MKELEYLKAWLEDNLPYHKYHIRPIQRLFTMEYKNFQNNVLYFGSFSDTVQVLTPFQVTEMYLFYQSPKPFLFSHLHPNTNVAATFIGWEITFENLLVQHAIAPWATITAFENNLLNWDWDTEPLPSVRVMYSIDGGQTFAGATGDPLGGIQFSELPYDAVFYLVNPNDDARISHNFQNVVVPPVEPDPPVVPQTTAYYYESFWENADEFHDPFTNSWVDYINADGNLTRRILGGLENGCIRIDALSIVDTNGCAPCVPTQIFTNQFNEVFL
ncbi:hypothetical protein D3C85_322530 [compost metagenome]